MKTIGSVVFNRQPVPEPLGERPTWACVDLSRMVRNYRRLKEHVGPEVGVLPVVKADAYGHGSVRVALRLQREGAVVFAVATAREGVELREAGIESPIYLLGIITSGELALVHQHSLIPAVYEPSVLEMLDEEGSATRIQAADPGQNRYRDEKDWLSS